MGQELFLVLPRVMTARDSDDLIIILVTVVESLATKQRNLLDELYDYESQEVDDPSRDPEEMPGFYEGDMAGFSDEVN